MNLLLDTHVLLWAAGSPDRLSLAARDLINDTSHNVFFSVASIWEITIKESLNRGDFRADARLLRRGLLDNGYKEINITSEHCLAVKSLPMLHRDPFDRLLVAQMMIEGFTLLTVDALVSQYSGSIRMI
jgi:PIN domain nuclease of toxin-antitoxin system